MPRSAPNTPFALGLALPQYGRLAEPAAVAGFAAAAEELGYASLWVGDRVLAPREASDIYPGGGTPEQPYPPDFVHFADPLVTLACAAAVTSSARLGASTLVAPVYPPVLLARALTSLDVASAGRLEVGLGIGWLRDEYAATGAPWAGRGAQLEEVLDVLDAFWTGDPLAHKGERWHIPPSDIGLRPAQKPRPPVLLGGYTPAALARAGRRADGWMGVALPRKYLRALWSMATKAAEEAGRDPGALRRIVRINPNPGKEISTIADTVAYLDEAREEGVTEAFVDLHYVAQDVAHALDLAAELRAAVKA